VPATVAAEVKALTGERAGLEYLRTSLLAEQQRAHDLGAALLALEALEVVAAKAILGIKSGCAA
jgi:hypothetical protein